MARTHSATTKPAAWSASQILFEDDWLIVVDKPAGLPSQPTLDPSRPNAEALLRDYLRQRDAAEPTLALQHRLDKDTSGVLLFTRDPRANAGAGALFSEKTAQKRYLALALSGAGCPEAWEVKNYLGPIGRVKKAVRFGAVRSGGDAALTTFRVLERIGAALLVEACPRTGRTHQIRVHLSGCGHPILGDALYDGPEQLPLPGGGRLFAPRVLLHAESLEFRHPITQQELRITSPLPEDFSLCMKKLGSAAKRP